MHKPDTWDESREARARRTVFIRNVHTTVTTGDLRRHIEVATGITVVEDVF